MFEEEAIIVLSHHQLTPHQLLTQLCDNLVAMIQLPDHKKRLWTFVMRRHCGLYLMAKTESMESFEELYSVRQ